MVSDEEVVRGGGVVRVVMETPIARAQGRRTVSQLGHLADWKDQRTLLTGPRPVVGIPRFLMDVSPWGLRTYVHESWIQGVESSCGVAGGIAAIRAL